LYLCVLILVEIAFLFRSGLDKIYRELK
jgi:hypothetical protein